MAYFVLMCREETTHSLTPSLPQTKMSMGYLFSFRHQRLLESQQVLKLSQLLLHHWRCHRWLIHLCRGSKPAYDSQYTSKFHSLEPRNLNPSRFLGCLCRHTNCLQALHDWSTEVYGANSLAVNPSSPPGGRREEVLLAIVCRDPLGGASKTSSRQPPGGDEGSTANEFAPYASMDQSCRARVEHMSTWVLLHTICCWLSYSCKLLLPLWEPPLVWSWPDLSWSVKPYSVASKFRNLVAESQGCQAGAAKSKQLRMRLM